MIYRSSYFKKELRQAYADDRLGLRRKAAFALFAGLLSFVVFFVLQTLRRSVLSDAVPEIMQPSFFSALYIYIHLSLPLNAAYFILYYDWLFFREISSNSWYLLIKLGYRPAAMIFSKLAALLLSVTAIYAAGFCAVVLLTVFLRYTLVLAYLPSLFFAGLVDLALLTAAAMTLSLFSRDTAVARYLTAAAALLPPVLKSLLGFYVLLKNRVALQDFRSLFDTKVSLYLPAAAILLLACTAVCSLRAGRLARYYTVPHDADAGGLPPGAGIARIDPRAGTLRPVPEGRGRETGERIAGAVLVSVAAALICLALAFNLFIILVGAATPGNEVTIRGTIPYIFQSDTMQPDILRNDLAYFRRVDGESPVEVGQIVLFRQNNVVYVERIVGIGPDGVTVDIDYYPPPSDTGAMRRTIGREDIYGVYTGRSRWLGALILFANTIVGRLLFLLVPVILLFYRKQLLRLLRSAGSGTPPAYP